MYLYILQGLTQAEEMLISAVMPIMSIYKLPHGQYGYSGHVINLPQDEKSFVLKLPRLTSEMDVLVIRREREQTHQDFHVHRRVVQQALTWLLENNIYYRSVGISVDEDALASLPDDGDLSDLPSFQPSDTDVSQAAQPPQDDASEQHYSTSFVPNAVHPSTERDHLPSSSRSGTVCIKILHPHVANHWRNTNQ